VVITGLGIVNPLGSTLETFWEALAQGRSGIKPITLFDASQLPARFAGQLVDFDAKKYIVQKERKSIKVMARTIQLAVAAAQLAMDDSGIDKAHLNPERFGVEFGAGLMATELSELAHAARASASSIPGDVDLQKWGDEGIPAIPPLWMLKYLPNMLACHVSILHNAQGPNNSITESEVAGLLALGEACRVMQRDQADFFLVGGADSKLNPLSLVRQCQFGGLSQRNDQPEKACRPFDRHRDGVVLGEGAGVLALEDLDHARRRGARIYAEIVGFGAAFDRGHNSGGLVRAIRAALAEAALWPEDLDHVNAHGSSTVRLDAWEARELREAFKSSPRVVPVFAPKSYFGSMGAASGPSELIASLLALRHGRLPATLNYDEPDPECPVPVQRKGGPIQRPFALKVGFTDMGQCAAVVCRHWGE
jgi:3-oxoacyl-[acyl-carrier-protein] synthase II